MNIWLDDIRDPKIHDPKGTWIWVKTADEAINALRTGNVKLISLDHDLGTDPDTGYTVAVWIEEQAWEGNLPELDWRVHSANPVGAKKIEAALFCADKAWQWYNKFTE